MGLERHVVARVYIAHVAPRLDNLTGAFVAKDERSLDARLRPRVPVIDMQVGAADRGCADLDEYVVGPDLGDVGLDQFRARFGA